MRIGLGEEFLDTKFHVFTSQGREDIESVLSAFEFDVGDLVARNVVNKLKATFGSDLKVDLLLKNTDNSHRSYKAGVDQIDNHIPEKYTHASLAQLLGVD